MSIVHETYDKDFYSGIAPGSEESARIVVPLVVQALAPRSVVDIGCGTGGWLKQFMENGVSDVFGMDGAYVPVEQLVIPREKFKPQDVSQGFAADRRFDLATSMEVAEHLPESAADRFVDSITKLSDIVMFSSAVPFQGGMDHTNEQWPRYWEEKYRKRGYICLDWFRPQLWQEQRIAWWYRQNLFLYVKEEKVEQLPEAVKSAKRPGDFLLLHQFVVKQMMSRDFPVKKAAGFFWESVVRAIRRRTVGLPKQDAETK